MAVEAKHYVVSYTRKQIIVTWGAVQFGPVDGIAHYPRTDKGQAAAERKIARLRADGYSERGL